MAAWSRRKRRSTSRTWRCAIRRRASRRALASRSWAKAPNAAKCASRKVLECRSMSDEEKTPKADAKPQGAPKGGGGEKKAKGKEAAAAPARPRTPKPKDYVPRMKARYRDEIR